MKGNKINFLRASYETKNHMLHKHLFPSRPSIKSLIASNGGCDRFSQHICQSFRTDGLIIVDFEAIDYPRDQCICSQNDKNLNQILSSEDLQCILDCLRLIRVRSQLLIHDAQNQAISLRPGPFPIHDALSTAPHGINLVLAHIVDFGHGEIDIIFIFRPQGGCGAQNNQLLSKV